MSVRYLTCALGLLAFAAACDSDDDTGLTSSNAALVQFVNASTITSATASGGTTIGGSLGSQQASSTCMLVSPGTQSLGFTNGGATIGTSATTNLQAGQRYTVILRGNSTSNSTIVLPENYTTQSSGNYGVRFINATSQAGDIFVTTPTGTISGTANSSLAAGAASGGTTGTNGFLTFPTANNRVRFFASGNTSTALSDYTIANPSSTSATTVVFTNNSTGGVTAFTVPQCTAP
jgi:hypothetical protein